MRKNEREDETPVIDVIDVDALINEFVSRNETRASVNCQITSVNRVSVSVSEALFPLHTMLSVAFCFFLVL